MDTAPKDPGKGMLDKLGDTIMSPTAVVALSVLLAAAVLITLPGGAWDAVRRMTGWGREQWSAAGTVLGAIATTLVFIYAFVQARENREQLRDTAERLTEAVQHLAAQADTARMHVNLLAAQFEPNFASSEFRLTVNEYGPAYENAEGQRVINRIACYHGILFNTGGLATQLTFSVDVEGSGRHPRASPHAVVSPIQRIEPLDASGTHKVCWFWDWRPRNLSRGDHEIRPGSALIQVRQTIRFRYYNAQLQSKEQLYELSSGIAPTLNGNRLTVSFKSSNDVPEQGVPTAD